MEPIIDYDRDIAPATSNFLRDVRTNVDLDPAAKRRIGSSFFADVSEVRNARDRNRAMAQQARMRDLDYEAGVFNLAQARQRAAEEENDLVESAGTDDEIFGIIDDEVATPEEKTAALHRLQIEKISRNPRNSYIHRKFAPALALVKPREVPLTNAQLLDAYEKGVSRDVIESGDVSRIGSALAEVEGRKRDEVLRKEAQTKREKDEDELSKTRRIARGRVTDLDLATDEATLKPDPTRFKNSTTATRIKEALAMSPDPEIRRIAASESDPAKLRAAFEKDALQQVTGPRYVLPPRK